MQKLYVLNLWITPKIYKVIRLWLAYLMKCKCVTFSIDLQNFLLWNNVLIIGGVFPNILSDLLLSASKSADCFWILGNS